MQKISLRRACVAVALALGLATGSQAQQLDPSFALTNLLQPSPVAEVAVQANGQRLIISNSTLADGQPANHLVRYNADGKLDKTFRLAVENYSWEPTRVLPLRSGKLLVVLGGLNGEFVSGSLRRRGVVRLLADGSVDASFNAGAGNDGTMHAVAEQPDGKLLLAGNMSQFSGVSIHDLVRLQADGAVDNSFSAPEFWNSQRFDVLALQPDGKLLVGGNIPNATSTPYHLVRLLPNGGHDTSFEFSPPANENVQALALQPNGHVLVAAGQQLVRVLPDGRRDPGFAAVRTTAAIASVALQPDGRVLLAGALGEVNGKEGYGAVRLLANGTRDFGFALPASMHQAHTQATTLVRLADGRLLLGMAAPVYPTGRLTSAQTALLLEENGSKTTWQPDLLQRGEVYSTAVQPDGQLLVGGDFSWFGGTRVANVLRLSSTGGLDTAFSRRAAVDYGVRGVAWQPGGKVLVAGDFAHNRTTTCRPLIRLLPSGELDATFAYQPAGAESFSYLGVDTWGGIVAHKQLPTSGLTGLLRLLPNGQPDPAFTYNSSEQIDRAQLLPDGRILLQTDNGLGIITLRRLLASGAADPSFSLIVFNTLNTGFFIDAIGVDAQYRVLIAETRFSIVTGVGVYQVQRYPAGGGTTPDPTFAAHRLTQLDWVRQIVVQPNGRILLAGDLLAGPVQRTALRRLLPDGRPDTGFLPVTQGFANVVLVQPDGRILLGGLEMAGATPGQAGLLRLADANVLQQSRPQTSATSLRAWPVPAHGLLHVSLDLAAQPQQLTLLDALGRTVRTQPATQSTVDLSVAELPAGTYLLRVSYATSSPATCRVIVE